MLTAESKVEGPQTTASMKKQNLTQVYSMSMPTQVRRPRLVPNVAGTHAQDPWGWGWSVAESMVQTLGVTPSSRSKLIYCWNRACLYTPLPVSHWLPNCELLLWLLLLGSYCDGTRLWSVSIWACPDTSMDRCSMKASFCACVLPGSHCSCSRKVSFLQQLLKKDTVVWIEWWLPWLSIWFS